MKKGPVLGNCYQRHRTEELLLFLKQIEKHLSVEVVAGKSIHLILDSYCTHKAAKVMRWLVAVKDQNVLPLSLFYFHNRAL